MFVTTFESHYLSLHALLYRSWGFHEVWVRFLSLTVTCRSQSGASWGNPGIWGRTPMVKVWASLRTTGAASEETCTHINTHKLSLSFSLKLKKTHSTHLFCYLHPRLTLHFSYLEVWSLYLQRIISVSVCYSGCKLTRVLCINSEWRSRWQTLENKPEVRHNRCDENVPQSITVTTGSEPGIRRRCRDGTTETESVSVHKSPWKPQEY